MTTHIFKVYLFFITLSFLFLLFSRVILTRYFGIDESNLIGVFVLSGFFIILGFPGIITIIRKEFVRPIGQPKSGLFAILGGIVYLVFTYGALVLTLYHLLN